MKCKKMVGAIGSWDKEITQRQQSWQALDRPGVILFFSLSFFFFAVPAYTKKVYISKRQRLFIIYEGIQCSLWDRVNIISPNNNIIELVETISDWRSARTLYGGVSLSLVVPFFLFYHEPNLDHSLSKLQSPTWFLNPEPGTTSSNKNTPNCIMTGPQDSHQRWFPERGAPPQDRVLGLLALPRRLEPRHPRRGLPCLLAR